MGDLLDPFWTYELFRKFCKNLIEKDDPAVTLLALEGYYCIESEVKSGQCVDTEGIKCFLKTLPNELEMVFSRLFPGPANEIAENLTFITNIGFERPDWDSPSTDNREFYRNLIEKHDPAVALLALEGLFCIKSGQFTDTVRNYIKNALQILRNKMPMTYNDRCDRAKKILRNLTIFKALQVPLFIDNYGNKELMSSFEATELEVITIDENTSIFHVTHRADARSIMKDKRIKGSANKNSIKGCWFGLDDPTQNESVYGTRAFETTLSKLGVTGVRQGEIISYKNEVNVILYAHGLETADSEVSKPTDVAAKKVMNPNAYVKVSIFVPGEFLPGSDRFSEVIRGPFEVTHSSLCVKEKREGECPDRPKIPIGELQIS